MLKQEETDVVMRSAADAKETDPVTDKKLSDKEMQDIREVEIDDGFTIIKNSGKIEVTAPLFKLGPAQHSPRRSLQGNVDIADQVAGWAGRDAEGRGWEEAEVARRFLF